MPHRKPRKSDENRVPHVIGFDPRPHHGPGLSDDHPQRRAPLPMGVTGRTVEFRYGPDKPEDGWPKARSEQRFKFGREVDVWVETSVWAPRRWWHRAWPWVLTFASLAVAAYLFATSGQ